MNISFPSKSAYDPNTTSIAFPVDVDGAARRCLVTEEALMDHFGATSPKPDHLRDIFEANRHDIESVAEGRIRAGVTGEVLLRSHDF
jgi:hypothetical protein